MYFGIAQGHSHQGQVSREQTANRTVHLSELSGHIKSVAITWHPDWLHQQSTPHRNVDVFFPGNVQTSYTPFSVSALAMNLKVWCPV